ncbi:MAG: multi-sensor signal transduction histidine kinase, partial [Polaromonas sp.]|nr:multi-sensor signal transduction histidine kinase [Polaromonas sp.]
MPVRLDMPVPGMQKLNEKHEETWLPRRLSLSCRLVLLVLAALVPVFGVFAWSTAKSQQASMLQVHANLQTQVLLAALHQQRQVDRTAQLLNDIASGPSIKDRRHPMCEKYLENLIAQNGDYVNLGAVNLDGKIFCRGVDSGRDVDASNRPYFKRVLATQQFSVGQYGLGQSGLPGIAFSVPIYDSQVVFNGIAFAVLKLAALDKALRAGTLTDGAQLRVIDRRGVVLAAYPARTGLPGTLEQDTVLLEALNAQQAGSREAVDVNGLERIYAYAPVSGAADGGIFVTISVSRDVVTAASRRLLLADLAVLLGMTAFGLACAWVLGKRLVVNPAHAILKQAKEIAPGGLLEHANSPPPRQDELGRLKLLFKNMVQSLQAQHIELDTALHQAIADRTMRDLILNSMSEGVIAVGTSGQFMHFNAAACKMFPAPGEGMVFDRWKQDFKLMTLDGKMIPPGELLEQTLRGGSINNLDLTLCRPDIPDQILRLDTRPLLGPDSQPIGGLAVFIDVTKIKAAERFALAQEKILILIAGGAPLNEALVAIVRLIENSEPQSVCSILLAKGGYLGDGIAPSLPQGFVQAINGLLIAEGSWACGTAAYRKEAVIVENLQQDPLVIGFREVLAANGLRACWSTPVTGNDGEVLAIFAIYRRLPGKPQPGDLALMAAATRLARLALERARAEAALFNSESRFRELAENVEDVFYSIDARGGRVRYISPGYEKVWGRSCESLYAAPGSAADAVVPEDRHLLKLASDLNEVGQTANIEYRIFSPDDQTRWIRDRSYPVFNAAGALERVVGTARDITQSKLAELALAATLRALHMLSRSSIAINCIHDEAGLLAEVCRVAVSVGGYRMAWVGYANDDEVKNIQPMAHAGEELGYLEAIALCWRNDPVKGHGSSDQAICTGLPQQIHDIRKADRKFHWRKAALQRGYLSALFLPLCSENKSFGVLCLYTGQVQEFAPEEVRLLQELADNLAFSIVSLRAQLERRRSEQIMRQAVAKLREQASLLDLVPDAIVVRNLDLTIRFWNKGAERLYGWSAEAVMGKTLLADMYRDPQVLMDIIKKIRGADVNWTGEREQVACNGSPVYVEMRGTVVYDENGQVNGVMIVNTDIRERRQARQDILQLNASLEERVDKRTLQLKLANQQLETFSYSVSHDLRSPLSSINGFGNLLEKSLTRVDAPPLNERSRHYLTRIRAGAAQMGQLIDAMLLLAQVSRAPLGWEAVDLSVRAKALLLDLHDRDPGRKAQLQVQSGLLVQGDGRLLQQ